MTALIILGIIAIIITVIMLIPIGADIAFEGGELRVSAKFAGFLLQLLPRPPKEPSKPKEKKTAEKKEPGKKPETAEKKPKKKLDLDFSFDEIMELLKKVLKGFGILGKKFRVERFLLDYLAAGRDPYLTARIFGCVNAALDTLAPICSRRFDVDELYVRTDIDFTTDRMKLDLGIAMTIRIGAIFRMVNTILFGALRILIKHKIKKLLCRKLSTEGGETDVPPENDEENIVITIQQEERMNENGE